jgi:hypothetical protein
LNLGSFVATAMNSEARDLVLESINKKLINSAGYPDTEATHGRVVEIFGRRGTFYIDRAPKGAGQKGWIAPVYPLPANAD